jgi:hypothetical protein
MGFKGLFAQQQFKVTDVRFGSQADMTAAICEIRFRLTVTAADAH